MQLRGRLGEWYHAEEVGNDVDLEDGHGGRVCGGWMPDDLAWREQRMNEMDDLEHGDGQVDLYMSVDEAWSKR